MKNFFEPEAKRQRKTPDWVEHLEEKGWAVVPNIISPERNGYYHKAMWDWQERLAPNVKRDQPETWTTENWPPYMRGLMQHWNAGHAEYVWEVRQEQSIIDAFSEIWGTDDLLVSFDGVCLSKRSRYLRHLDRQDWSHIDQGSGRRGRQAVQGLLSITEAGPTRGGLLVYSGSHKLHDEFFKAFPDMVGTPGDKKNWVKLTDEQKKWYFDNGAVLVQPEAPAGSLILWDSRTGFCRA